jgi:two-component system, chemotaxis family, chemotaxis protein CheY
MKFLVIDGSATMRRIVVDSLRRIGFTETVEAADCAEALERIDGSIGFVITDRSPTRAAGLEFVRALRSSSERADLPVLMVTTRSGRHDILAAAAAGVNNYIAKPFTPELLRAKIEQLLPATACRAE